MSTKYCPRCQDTKTITEFGNNRSTKDGHTAYCKSCWSKINTEYQRTENGKKLRKKYNDCFYEEHRQDFLDNQAEYRQTLAGKIVARRCLLKRQYGLTIEKYNKMLKDQGGVCACCETDKAGGNSIYFRVDHCHNTGVVRGLICNKCNTALGLAGDNIEGVMNLVKYLKKAQKQRPGKLDYEKASEIRRLYSQEDVTQKELAIKYGVTQAAIGRVINNITYKEKKLGFSGESQYSIGYIT